MFDRIVLRRSDRNSSVSFGEIAEALIFYKNVHLVLDPTSAMQLVRQIGADNFFRLLTLKKVSATYIEEYMGVKAVQLGYVDQYEIVAASIFAKGAGKPTRVERAAERIFQMAGFDKKASIKHAEKFFGTAKLRSLSSDDFIKGGVIKAAYDDLRDGEFVTAAIRRVVAQIAPNYPNPEQISFEVIQFRDHFQVSTNLELPIFRSAALVQSPSISSLIVSLAQARADLAMAGYYGCDFRTSLASSEVVRLRSSDLLRRSGMNADELSLFREVVLDGFPHLGRLLDEGDKTPEDFFSLLEASDKFGCWISGVAPDEKLVAEYLRSTASRVWIDSSPGRLLRFVFSFGAGMANPAVGAVVSLADSFLLERLLGGWRPSHFIDGKLKPFLSD
ncbi:hypothetical protein EIM48_13755 [Pseudoxanthomonas sp. SGNA-20]|uniref:hypothetical protein n=1 Tax=Pseudoxanthomonas sp. SGNA-20 TaxID=2493088 RepID=UPI000F6430B1|nr:hypothetical protein [Pseudoxanthomonas sp. SGNA-20]RRN54611.1 hypothetical protein EIM48_13755 [Pseudoxanthomonas sp. SGNA-20]